jgi:simple sugar transport system substrate-binding protein
VVWGGVKEGMIRVGDFGPKVPQAVRAEVLNAQKAMAQGKLQPFHASDAVRDNEGHVVIAKGETLNDEKILGMNWLVAGVQGKINH